MLFLSCNKGWCHLKNTWHFCFLENDLYYFFLVTIVVNVNSISKWCWLPCKTVFKWCYKQKNVIFAFIFSGEDRCGKEGVKENVRSLCYSRGFLYSQDSLTKWTQLVNCYTVRSREKPVFWFSFPYFPQPTSSINFWFEFRLINLGSKQLWEPSGLWESFTKREGSSWCLWNVAQ